MEEVEANLDLGSDRILNLFDQDTVTGRVSEETWDAVYVGRDDFFRGIDVQSLIEDQQTLRNPYILMDWRYQAPREIRLGVKFLF